MIRPSHVVSVKRALLSKDEWHKAADLKHKDDTGHCFGRPAGGEGARSDDLVQPPGHRPAWAGARSSERLEGGRAFVFKKDLTGARSGAYPVVGD